MSKSSLFWDGVSLLSHISTGAGLGKGLAGRARLREIDATDPVIRSYLEKNMGRELTGDDAQYATSLAFKTPEEAAPAIASLKRNKQIGSAVGGTLGAGVFGARKYVARRQAQNAKRKTRNMIAGATGLGVLGVGAGVAANEHRKRGKDKLASIFRSNSEAALIGALSGGASDLTRHLLSPAPLTANRLASVPVTAAASGAAAAGARATVKMHEDAAKSKRNRKLLVGALAVGTVAGGGYMAKRKYDERKNEQSLQLKTAGFGSMLGHLFAPNMMHAAGAGLMGGAIGGIANVAREGANIAKSFGPKALANASVAEKAALTARQQGVRSAAAGKEKIFENRDVAAHAFDKVQAKRNEIAKAQAGLGAADATAHHGFQKTFNKATGQWEQGAAITRGEHLKGELDRYNAMLGKLDKHRHKTIQPGVAGHYMPPMQVPLMTGNAERGAASMSAIRAGNAAKAPKIKAQYGEIAAARNDKALAQQAQGYAGANGGQMPSLTKDPKGFMGQYGGRLAGAFARGAAPGAAIGAAGKYGLDAMRAHKMRQAFKTWAPPVLIGGAAYGLLNRD